MSDEDENGSDDKDTSSDEKSKSKSRDEKSSKDKKDKSDKDSSEKSSDDKKKKDTSGGVHWGTKVLRTFLFAAVAGFLTGVLFADPLPNGLRVDFDVVASIKLGLITGVVAAVLRTIVALLPVFSDD